MDGIWSERWRAHSSQWTIQSKSSILQYHPSCELPWCRATTKPNARFPSILMLLSRTSATQTITIPGNAPAPDEDRMTASSTSVQPYLTLPRWSLRNFSSPSPSPCPPAPLRPRHRQQPKHQLHHSPVSRSLPLARRDWPQSEAGVL